MKARAKHESLDLKQIELDVPRSLKSHESYDKLKYCVMWVAFIWVLKFYLGLSTSNMYRNKRQNAPFLQVYFDLQNSGSAIWGLCSLTPCQELHPCTPAAACLLPSASAHSWLARSPAPPQTFSPGSVPALGYIQQKNAHPLFLLSPVTYQRIRGELLFQLQNFGIFWLPTFACMCPICFASSSSSFKILDSFNPYLGCILGRWAISVIYQLFLLPLRRHHIHEKHLF